jgi:predicted nucleic acid-binding protein
VSGYLVDTNVLSELTRVSPEPKVEAFLRSASDNVYVSALSIGEIFKGIGCLAQGARRASLDAWLTEEMIPWFGDRVLPVTLPIAERWGGLAAEAKLQGKPRPVVDALIAATAIEHGLTLVTRNVRDYVGTAVVLLNPWPESDAR